MTRITLQKFDGLTLEERDAYLERRDQDERERALRRNIAQPSAIFKAYAVAILRERAELIFDLQALSKLAAENARRDGVTSPRTGEPYSDKTVYSHYINPKRLELLKALREPLAEPLNAS